MTSPADPRAQLRAERIASEAALSRARAQRRRILILAGALLSAAVVAVAVIVVASSHGRTRAHRAVAAPSSAPAAPSAAPAAQSRIAAAQSRVKALLAGIPESSDNVLGRATAPDTIIEYGDLECVVCDSFALSPRARVSDGTPGTGIEDQIITKLIRTGRAKLVYDSLDTATADGATPSEFVPQQAAAYAAGLQDRGWFYIELFYNEQHPEGTDYVNRRYLDAIAKQVPGLDYAEWRRDSTSARLDAQVVADNTRGTEVDGGAAGTPTVVVQSRRAGVLAAQGIPTLVQVEQAMQAVG